MRSILIVDADAGFCERARVAVERAGDVRVESVPTIDDALALKGAADRALLFVGPGIRTADALAAAGTISRAHPDMAVVMVVPEESTDLLRQAMRAGVHDVIPADRPWEEVATAIGAAVSSTGDRPQPIGAAASEAAKRGRTVTVFSTKGGVGKSVVACNVAAALAGMGADVILVDLDLQFGDTGIMLDLKPERTIFDAVQCYERLDAEMLRGFLIPHSSGLRVLLAPVHPEDADAVTASRVASILGMLRELAEIVVVDTSASFDDVVLAAIDVSDEVYAVATMDVASIKNTRVSLQKLAQLGYDAGRTKVVLNRADSKVWLDLGEVEQSIDAETIARIPSDRLVPRSVNRGVPVVIDAPRSAVARSLLGLAKRIKTEGEVTGDVA
ncbi:MAG: P-loop NTPase [Coriobacteriia bacterium]|nr:P-loop NTPase [Coriobacteriia bacterium]